MRLIDREWKEFKIKDLFGIRRGSITSLNEIDEGTTPIVSASGSNEGIDFFGDVPALYNNNITISMNGVNTGFTAYHGYDFNINVDCCVLIQKFTMNAYIGEFIATIIGKLRYRYSYGRKMSAERIMKETIKLPVDSSGNSDWQFMEDYIKSLHHKPLTTKNKPGQAPELNVQNWKEFIFTDIFILKGGFYNKKPEHSVDGNIPFLASSESSNGVTEYYSIEDINEWDKVGNEDNTLDKKIYAGNCIAVTVNGSVCNAFYQKDDFTCSHDITVFYLKHHKLTPVLAMFLCTIIMGDKYKWSYGRKPHDVRKFGKSVIKLPVDSSGNPDWQFMENYIKALPYGDRLP